MAAEASLEDRENRIVGGFVIAVQRRKVDIRLSFHQLSMHCTDF